MGLARLPTELLFGVADYLANRDISALARSCRCLHAALDAFLYQHDARERGIAFIWAHRRRRMSIVQKSLENGCYALSAAAAHGDVAMMKGLIQDGADVNYCGVRRGHPPLHKAVLFRQVSAAWVLLKNGASVEARDDKELDQSPLFIAARSGSHTLARLLLVSGATLFPGNITPDDRLRETHPLTAAIENDRADLIRLFLDHEDDAKHGRLSLETRDGIKQQALMKAVLCRSTKVVKTILSCDVRDGTGKAWMAWTVDNGDASAVRAFIQAGADPNAAFEGVSPLARAAENFCCHRSEDTYCMIRVLLKAGASPHTRDQDGVTPLGIAALNANSHAVRVLLKAGASPNVANKYGWTPLDMADSFPRSDRRRKMVVLLRCNGAIDRRYRVARYPASYY